MATKIVFLIADGMGDYPLDELGSRTPLEATTTLSLDRLSQQGIQGLAQSVPANMPPGSDVANMALLGYPPQDHHTGRGPIEAAAQGLKLAPNDLVWRLNLVNTDSWRPGALMRDYAGGHIDTPSASRLIRELNDSLGNTDWELIPGIQYRHLLVQRNGAQSPEASLDIRPPHDILDQTIDQDLEAFATSPDLDRILTAAAKHLRTHSQKATALWPWGQGQALDLPSFQFRFGLKGQVVSGVDLVKGLGRAAHMDVAEVPGATGLLDTDYAGKVKAALDFLDTGDFVYLHVEAPDECGHAGDVQAKMEAISRFDQQVIAPLYQALGQQALFLFTCDHFTPIVKRTHTRDPIPFLLFGSGIGPNTAAGKFNEATATETGLFIDSGDQLLPFVLKHLDPKP